MKYSVKFYPERRNGKIENVPVRLSVTYPSNRMEYYTGKRCNIDEDPKKSQWDIETSRMKKNQIAPDGSTSSKFNSDLDEIKVAIDSLFKIYDATKVTPTPDQLRNDLKTKLGKEVKKEQEPERIGIFARFDQYIKDAPLSHGRKKHLKTTYNKAKEFNPNTSFENLTIQYLTEFQNYLLGDCNLSKNTVISELRRFRAFYSYAIKHEWTNQDPFKSFSIGQESFGDPVFISIDERDKLFNAKIENESLARVRDIFVFQCLVGCRVGDLTHLKKSNIIDGCIEYIASKTKDDKTRVARIPLTEKAKAILAKYDLPDGAILPFISDQKYNEGIKKLFKLDSVKLTRIVTVADPKTRMNVQKSIADVASSHMARRVFVGGLHRKGIKNETIASMSGHAENSRAFSRYYNIDKEDQKEAMKAIE
jgi:site-specific recombinase XerD